MATDKFLTKENLEDTLKALRKKNFSGFSTTETRVGTWVDGKPLYRKAFTGSSNTYADTYRRRSFAIPLNGTETYMPIRCGGIVTGNFVSGASITMPLLEGQILLSTPFGYQWFSTLLKAGSAINLYWNSRNDNGNSNFLSVSYEIWIEYIKTTD